MTEHNNPGDGFTTTQPYKTQTVSREEVRFVEYWKEQRQGSKFKYVLLYSISWGFMATLFSFFIIMFLGGISIIPIAQDNYKIGLIVGFGLLTGTLIAFITWRMNERKYFRILEKVRRNMMN